MKFLKFIFCLLFLTFVSVLQVHAAKPLNVVATYSILGDWVKEIGGDKIHLSVLVGPNGDAHTFEPTPQESVVLSQADIIFENGLGFETWLNDLYASSASRAERVVVTSGIDPIALEEEEGEDGHDAEHEEEHHHGDTDPHVWHSVKNAITAVKEVTAVLITKDPENQSYYEAQQQRYISTLEQLDQWVSEQVSQVPAEKRKLVTSHDTFGYLARDYGFEVVGTAIDSATTEAADPSAGQIAELVEKIKSSQVPVIFTENVHSPKLMEALANEAKVKVAPALFTDALGDDNSDGKNYIEFMKYNIRIITEELKK